MPEEFFKKILIANRGEISVRVAKTAKEMGIATLAIYTASEKGSLHCEYADEAVALKTDAMAGYLDMDNILEIARQHGCDAIHPGYGFLSENARFAKACSDAGVTFIGPLPETIEQMGDKVAARALMEAAKVPVIPGANEIDSVEAAKKASQEVGFPLLVKAAAGGGGKGMRRVDSEETLEEAVLGAQREAESAFGNGTVYLERFIAPARHIEVQIMGDSHGRVVHLGERDCSAQRRYQKVVEQCPAPELSENARDGLHEAAVQAALAVNYCGAGTVEFVVGPDEAFYFLEMNTRLQVEHPVTEEVYGVDLVAEQIRVAAGKALRFTQSELKAVGVSLECRLYAEAPERGFMPSPGPLLYFKVLEGEGLRVDTGFQSGDEVRPDFDPMIAKVISFGPDRGVALERMHAALANLVVMGTRTNLEFLQDLMVDEQLTDHHVDTGYLERTYSEWTRSEGPSNLAFALAALARDLKRSKAPSDTQDDADIHSPWMAGIATFGAGGLP
jgi:acetyl/propionyl-CoA carboxylase alpha subunit